MLNLKMALILGALFCVRINLRKQCFHIVFAHFFTKVTAAPTPFLPSSYATEPILGSII